MVISNITRQGSSVQERRTIHSVVRPAASRNEWTDPVPHRCKLPPVVAFTENLLPDVLRRVAADLAERLQVPIDFPAVIGMLTLAGAVGRRVQIQPKTKDDGWLIVPNLWGGIAAPVGYLKSPVIQTMVRPLVAVEDQWRRDHQRDLAQYNWQLEDWETRNSVRKEQLKEQLKRVAKGSEVALPDVGPKPGYPVARRIVVNDTTPEKLHETMRDSPHGVLVIRDELTGWLADMGKSGREGERAFHLTAWSGDSSFTVDRIGRGSIYVPHCCESIIGGIQPTRLKQYLSSSSPARLQADGLIQRFQLLVWPDMSPDWEYVDRQPDKRAAGEWVAVLTRLVKLNPLAGKIPIFVFSPEAQETFHCWTEDLHREIKSDQMPEILATHLSKFPSLMPSLALLLELAERLTAGSVGSVGFGDGRVLEVSSENAKRAWGWCDYLRTHATRIYSMVNPALNLAQELSKRIRAGTLGTEFTPRDVCRRRWSGFTSAEVVKQAAAPLIQAGWIREEIPGIGPKGGRPSLKYLVNPNLKNIEF